ncbi:MAG: tRNA-dihydrouridine synthase [Bacteroidales bacterium]|nr:tRNA-dihydrouridine synthase [Bacteroidales bacterium]
MILAPMQGLTELLFRRTYEECFPGAIRLAISPFLSLTHGITQRREFSLEAVRFADVWPAANRGSIPVVPQILGKEPEEFVALANALADAGYSEVNWNIGCPMRAITAKHRGSGILPYPDEVRALLEAVMPRMRAKLSVKMRLGLKDKGEILALVPVLNDFPLASVAIHPRLGRQQYTGQCDLDAFCQAADRLRHRVIYNGDITSAADAQRVHERWPQVAELMVGRGVLSNPTLPLELAGVSFSEAERHTAACRLIRRLMEAIGERYGTSESAVRKAKEYWCLLWHSLPVSEVQARQVLRAGEWEAVDKMVKEMTQ